MSEGNSERARWAVVQGMMGCPFDSTSWGDMMDVAHTFGEGEVERVIRDARAVLSEDAEELLAMGIEPG